MNAFQRILIGLDLTRLDNRLIQYLDLVSQGFPPPKAYFLHVSYAREMPVMVNGRYTREQPSAALRKSLEKRVMQEMKAEVDTQLNLEKYEANFEIVEGTITRQMLEYADDKAVDLTILGKKRVHSGSGVAAHRFLRKTSSSVLFVPEGKAVQLNQLTIATDFSLHSDYAVNRGLQLARSLPTPPKITFLHVYDVPTDVAAKISRTQGQFAHIMRENAASAAKVYLDRFELEGLETEVKLIENAHYNAARHLYTYLKEQPTDLLIMGARGHSTLTAWVLGSVVEKLLRYNEDVPMLIVRQD